MRDSEVTRVLQAPLSDVQALLTPETIVRYEGSHVPRSVSEGPRRTVVTTRPSGRLIELQYVFETAGDRIRYRRDGAAPPLLSVETTIECRARDEGTELRLRSEIEPTAPLPFLGRYAAWRRRRTLERLADRLATELAAGGPTARR